MGQQSSTATWSVDDWAYGTGVNAVSAEEVISETSKLPAKLFGGKVIGNDPSIQQIQQDFLSLDETFKRLFVRKKKNKRGKKEEPVEEEFYQPEEQQWTPVDKKEKSPEYLEPVVVEEEKKEIPDPETPKVSTPKLIWHCPSCAKENKTTESICRRCQVTETSF